jgi:hypothetical protein
MASGPHGRERGEGINGGLAGDNTVDGRSASGSCPGHAFDALTLPIAS